MMDFIMAPLIVGIITLGIYKLFELFVRKRERITLIEKLGDKVNVENLQGKLSLPSFGDFHFNFTSGALKASLLMIGVGIGLLTGFIICAISIPYYMTGFENWDQREIAGVIYGSSVLIFGGLGLLAAFLIEIKIGKKDTDR